MILSPFSVFYAAEAVASDDLAGSAAFVSVFGASLADAPAFASTASGDA